MPLAVSSIHCLLWGDLESLTCQGYNFNSSIPVAKQKYQSNTTRSKVKALPGLHRGQINLTKLTYWILNILNIICTFWNWYSFVIAFTCFKLPEFFAHYMISVSPSTCNHILNSQSHLSVFNVIRTSSLTAFHIFQDNTESRFPDFQFQNMQLIIYLGKSGSTGINTEQLHFLKWNP